MDADATLFWMETLDGDIRQIASQSLCQPRQNSDARLDNLSASVKTTTLRACQSCSQAQISACASISSTRKFPSGRHAAENGSTAPTVIVSKKSTPCFRASKWCSPAKSARNASAKMPRYSKRATSTVRTAITTSSLMPRRRKLLCP